MEAPAAVDYRVAVNLARDLALLAFDERSAGLSGGARLDNTLAGAELVSLVRLGRVAVDRGRATVVDRTPSPDPQLEFGFATLAASVEPQWVHVWLARRAFALGARYLERLQAEGSVERRRSRRLGVFPVQQLRLASGSDRADLVDRVRSAALDTAGDPGDRIFAALVQLAGLAPGAERDRLARLTATLVGTGSDGEPQPGSTGSGTVEPVTTGEAELAALRATAGRVRGLPRPERRGSGLDPDVQRAFELNWSAQHHQ